MTTAIQKLTSDANFLKLHRKLSKFNIFKATGIENQEIKHTQFLGYLLDPNEAHGFKEEFLVRFLQTIPIDNIDNKINILDCNFSYATVKKECSLALLENNENARDEQLKTLEESSAENEKSKASRKRKYRLIDIIIKIPSISQPYRDYTIAIENKIRAQQSKDQLKNYKDSILRLKTTEEGRATFLFLTIDDEDESENWISIRYSNTVLDAIRGLINDLDETLSTYMKYVLTDYVEHIESIDESRFINDSNETDDPEKLSAEISKKHGEAFKLTNSLKSDDEFAKLEKEHAKIKYSKAFEYLGNYDADPRKGFLKVFEGLLKSDDPKYKPLRYEASTKSYFNFSFLDEDFFFLTENDGQILFPRKNLIFSIAIRPFTGKDEIYPEIEKFYCKLTLMLGPTKGDHFFRQRLFRIVQEAYKVAHDEKFNEDRQVSAQYSYIRLKYGKREVKARDDIEEWLGNTLADVADKEVAFFSGVRNDLVKLAATEMHTGVHA